MTTPDEILRIARSQLGTGERGDGWTKYGKAYEQRKRAKGFARAPWCDMFLGWCADRASGDALKVIGDFAYTPYHARWFRDRGSWGRKPRKGAIVFFDWGGSRSISAIDHVGIVEAVRRDGSVVTIEGNTSNAVRRRVRRSGIAGYGYPAYSGGGGKPPPTSKPGEKAPRWPGRYLRQPPIMSGGDVRTWQAQMRKRGWRITVDGQYGPNSANTAHAFQAEKGLEVDGVIGPDTWRATWETPIT